MLATMPYPMPIAAQSSERIDVGASLVATADVMFIKNIILVPADELDLAHAQAALADPYRVSWADLKKKHGL